MDALLAALDAEGLWFLVVGAVIGGLVRGFSGFGTAMVFLPVAAQVVPPFEALTILIVMDLIGPVPNIRRALRDGHPADVMRLSVGAVLALPLGVLVLSLIPPEAFRYAVSLLSLGLLVALLGGIRVHGTLTRPMIFGTGGLSGFLAGSAGLAGPPVVLLYMASLHPVQVIRANIMLFLILTDVMLLAVFWLNGYLVATAAVTGAILTLPYLLANMAGAAIFAPNREGIYRAAAYTIIAGSAIRGLPLLD